MEFTNLQLLDKEHTQYPSRYAIGEEVDLDFANSKYIRGVLVYAIKFTPGKVWYDIQIPYGFEEATIIKDIDSIIVVDHKEIELNKN